MSTTGRLASLAAISAVVGGCASTTVHAPPGAPPTARSVTHDNPGGDAADPHQAALQRQLDERWGFQEDKDGQLRIPLVDWRNWERVRYWVLDHFVGFKYGNDYHVLNAVFLDDLPEGAHVDSKTCMMRAEKWTYPQLKSFEVKLSDPHFSEVKWQGHSVMVKSVDGYVDLGFERRRFSAAYAAYDAYPDACLVFGVAVPWRDQQELAQKVRDRWIKEAVPLMKPLTPTRPYRK
ncbi:MAG TPA: hypothetical protein VH062_06030 [Polyangiaceae bacterium]|jgi:hypothetical protein|nr:hypothetical protein [Polyangiaceae bacterium]